MFPRDVVQLDVINEPIEFLGDSNRRDRCSARTWVPALFERVGNAHRRVLVRVLNLCHDSIIACDPPVTVLPVTCCL